MKILLVLGGGGALLANCWGGCKASLFILTQINMAIHKFEGEKEIWVRFGFQCITLMIA